MAADIARHRARVGVVAGARRRADQHAHVPALVEIGQGIGMRRPGETDDQGDSGKRYLEREQRSMPTNLEASVEHTSLLMRLLRALKSVWQLRSPSEIRFVGSRDRGFVPAREVAQPAFGADMFLPKA